MLTLPDFSGLRVHVIGDAIRDVYTHATCLGAASKSPTLVYARGPSQDWVGGAGVVAAHCEEAGATVSLTTAEETIKERIVVEGVKVIECHERPESVSTVPYGLRDIDVVILADFGHGMFTPERIRAWCGFYPDALIAADSQTTDISWGNILDFAGCDLLFANEREARFALRDQESDLKMLAIRVWDEAKRHGTKATFLKLGARGLAICSEEPSRHLRAYAREPIVDPIGAGDALLAYATLTYAVTKDLDQAGIIGSLAAAVACAHEGNIPVTRAAVEALSAGR